MRERAGVRRRPGHERRRWRRRRAARLVLPPARVHHPRRQPVLDRRAARRAHAGVDQRAVRAAQRPAAPRAAPGRHARRPWGDRFSDARPLHPAAAGAPRRAQALERHRLRRPAACRRRELRRYVSLPFELNEGDGALRAWIELEHGRPKSGTVDLALRAVSMRLAAKVEPLVVEQVQGGWRRGATTTASPSRCRTSASSPATACAGRRVTCRWPGSSARGRR